jgi:hypothetical protein
LGNFWVTLKVVDFSGKKHYFWHWRWFLVVLGFGSKEIAVARCQDTAVLSGTEPLHKVTFSNFSHFF